MSVWVVGRDEDGTLGKDRPLFLTYPEETERSIIYFQGRPTPALRGEGGGRHLGTIRSVERFSGIALVAVEVDVSAWLWHRRLP